MTKKEAFFHGILLALGVYHLQAFLFGSLDGPKADAKNLLVDFKMIADDADSAADRFAVLHTPSKKDRKAQASL